MSSQSILTIVREALPLFSDDFRQEINEKLSNDVHVIVRATPRNKDEVKGWLEEFARLAGVCYVVKKEHRNAAEKLIALNIYATIATEIRARNQPVNN